MLGFKFDPNMFYCRHILDKSGKSAQLCYVHEYEKEYKVLLARRPRRSFPS